MRFATVAMEDAPFSDPGIHHELRIDEHEVAQLQESILEASYFDASTMAALTPASLAAIARLRAYKPPSFSTWDRLPLSRRAAVLILLFADRRGDLRIVITMRAMTLRNYSGQAALPGGKADTLTETPWEIARREAWEEIGLPEDDSKIPAPFRIEHLCQLPFSFAKTALAVRPCVAFIHTAPSGSTPSTASSTVGESMIPKLDAKEVSAVFSAGFHNFLREQDEVREGQEVPGSRKDWYKGHWVPWYDGRWRMHYFYVPITNQKVSRPKRGIEEGEEIEDNVKRYLVWGMTARILVDAARVAYGEEPEFEHNSHYGDEAIIEMLQKAGRLGEKIPGGPDLTEPVKDINDDTQDAEDKDSKI